MTYRFRCLSAFALGFGVLTGTMLCEAAPACAADNSPKDPIQGLWKLIKVEGNAPAPKNGLDKFGLHLRLEKSAMYFIGSEGPKTWTIAEAKFKLNRAATPKQIDLTVTRGSVILGKGDAMIGIYEVDGDKLRLRLVNARDERPTSFKLDPRAREGIWHLERQK